MNKAIVSSEPNMSLVHSSVNYDKWSRTPMQCRSRSRYNRAPYKVLELKEKQSTQQSHSPVPFIASLRNGGSKSMRLPPLDFSARSPKHTSAQMCQSISRLASAGLSVDTSYLEIDPTQRAAFVQHTPERSQPTSPATPLPPPSWRPERSRQSEREKERVETPPELTSDLLDRAVKLNSTVIHQLRQDLDDLKSKIEQKNSNEIANFPSRSRRISFSRDVFSEEQEREELFLEKLGIEYRPMRHYNRFSQSLSSLPKMRNNNSKRRIRSISTREKLEKLEKQMELT